MKRGDLVTFSYKRHSVQGIIADWNGDPDRLAVVMDADADTQHRYVDGCQNLADSVNWDRHDDVVAFLELKRRLTDVLESKKGRQSLRDAKSRPARREGVPPSQGIGALPAVQEPLTLTGRQKAEDGTPDWTKRFEHYIVTDQTPYGRAERDLLRRYPHYYEIFMRNVTNSEKLNDIARELGIKPANARQRKHRAERFIQERLQAYQEQSQ